MSTSPLRQFILPFERRDDAIAAPPPTPPVEAPAAPVDAAAAAPVSAWTVEYVRHAKARRYLLRVRVDGRVRATIPRGGTRREAVRFVDAHREWIAKQLQVAARVRANRPQPMPDAEKRAHLLRAKRELPPRLLELAAQFNLTVTKISIRNQRWRWGSCSREGHISLNWRLVNMPDWVRDYVLIHELMHLRRMDHSPAFWKHVAVACPDYQRARDWLREHSQRHVED